MDKDFLFKIMFAVEIAFLLLVVASKILFPDWMVSAVIVAIIVAKAIMLLIKNPADNKHVLLYIVGNIIVLDFLAITFACYGEISIWLVVWATVSYTIEEIARWYFYYKPSNQIIDALLFSVELIMFLALAGLSFIAVNDALAQVMLLAISFASTALAVWRIYIFVRYYVLNKKRK